MADTLDPRKRSQVMAAVRSSGNRATELRLKQILRQYQITGWRRNFRIAGKPDFAFPDSKLAIFVDGCFWHGCPQHLRMPRENRAYWRRKIGRNRKRDRTAMRALRNTGWYAMRIWEHELRFPNRVMRRLRRTLQAARARGKIR